MNPDNVISAGVSQLTTDCPCYCGNIPTDRPFSSTAELEVSGYEQARNSDLQTPVKAQFNFTVQNQECLCFSFSYQRSTSRPASTVSTGVSQVEPARRISQDSQTPFVIHTPEHSKNAQPD